MAKAVLIATGKQTRSGRAAIGVAYVATRETDAGRCQPIDVGRFEVSKSLEPDV